MALERAILPKAQGTAEALSTSFILTLQSLSSADVEEAGQDMFPHETGVARQLSLLFIVFSLFYTEEKGFDSLQRCTKISDKLELKINEEEVVERVLWAQMLTTTTEHLRSGHRSHVLRENLPLEVVLGLPLLNNGT